jgi:hypothetical protein
MLQPAMRSNWQLCDALPFSPTRRGSPDVAGWSAYPSIAVIPVSFPDRPEGPLPDSCAAAKGDLFDHLVSAGEQHRRYIKANIHREN